MTEKSATTQVHRIVIKATAQAIWDAITRPEWTEKYAYGGGVDYELKAGGDDARSRMGPDVLYRLRRCLADRFVPAGFGTAAGR